MQHYGKDFRQFRRFRNFAGLTIEEIEARTHIKAERLEKFEAGSQGLNARELSASWRVLLDGVKPKLSAAEPVDPNERNEMLRFMAALPDMQIPELEEPAAAGFKAFDEAMKPKRRKTAKKLH
jgi:transcriptional regulator with XRE-family HTH domain